MLWEELIDLIINTGRWANAKVMAKAPPWLRISLYKNSLIFFLYFGKVLTISFLYCGKSNRDKLIDVAKIEIQNTTVTKSTFCREYLDNTEDKDNKRDTTNIKKNAILIFNFLMSKFKKKLDDMINPKPQYWIRLSFSFTIK